MILEVNDIEKRFGGIKALDGVSVSLEKNTIVGLIGPNGSGKTTLLNTVSGFLTPDRGTVFFLKEGTSHRFHRFRYPVLA
jgi:branched-chain amino acid transport system ATP-binding protein